VAKPGHEYFPARQAGHPDAVHDFCEEVYILDGAITGLRLDQAFTADMYVCRPPGMPHGPWHSPDGYPTFEVRMSERFRGDAL
jgi:hypothetical protein